MKSKLFVRIVAIVLAVIMIAGVAVAAIQVFAAPMPLGIFAPGCDVNGSSVIPCTGDEPMTWIIVAFIVAAVLIVAGFAFSIKNKKDKTNTSAQEKTLDEETKAPSELDNNKEQ